MHQSSLFTTTTPDTETFDRAWRDRCTVAEVSRSSVHAIVVQRHYLHCWPAIPTCILGLIADLEVIGACIFSIPPRETEIRYGGATWELARLWIDDRAPKNAETWFIARAVKHVKRMHRHVVCLVSYADPSQGHEETIYRAANWTADGISGGNDAYFWNNKIFHRRTHMPEGANWVRIARQSKHRFFLRLKARALGATAEASAA